MIIKETKMKKKIVFEVVGRERCINGKLRVNFSTQISYGTLFILPASLESKVDLAFDDGYDVTIYDEALV